MLIGCFDESGSSGEGSFVSIAGFVATEERWAAFDAAWTAALAKHRVAYLHTTDLANFRVLQRRYPRLDTLTFGDMRTTPGLQAADLLAYEQIPAVVVSPHPSDATSGIHVPFHSLRDSSRDTCVLQHDNFRVGEPSTDAV